MRIRRRVVVAGVAAACVVAGVVVAVVPSLGGSDRTPAAATGTGVSTDDGDPTPTEVPPPSSGAGPGSRAGGSPGTTAPRPVTVPARPAATVAKDSPASVSYLRERYGVGPDEAARRLALQELSAPLAERLAEEFPREYGGMWLDQPPAASSPSPPPTSHPWRRRSAACRTPRTSGWCRCGTRCANSPTRRPGPPPPSTQPPAPMWWWTSRPTRCSYSPATGSPRTTPGWPERSPRPGCRPARRPGSPTRPCRRPATRATARRRRCAAASGWTCRATTAPWAAAPPASPSSSRGAARTC